MLFSKIAYCSAFVCAAIPTVAAIPELAAKADRYVRPIVVDVEAVPLPSVLPDFSVHVFGEKVRDCELLTITGYAVTDAGMLKVPLTFPDDPAPGSSRPEGKQDFGVWSFDLSAAPQASAVFAHTRHDCSTPWVISTDIGPWQTPSQKKG